MSGTKKSKSSLHYLLKGLIPYTRENLQLSFHPNQFFNELERLSGYSHKTFQNTTRKAEINGYIRRKDNLLELTAKGKQKIKPFVASKLNNNAKLMIIFDIPESEARLRQRLRLLLREWRFVQEQKSVWVSDLDYRKELIKAVHELGLKDCVQIFEAAKLFPK